MQNEISATTNCIIKPEVNSEIVYTNSDVFFKFLRKTSIKASCKMNVILYYIYESSLALGSHLY